MPKNRSKAAPNHKSRKSDGDYVIGKGRPPKEYQFPPGQSGNPKGRKKNKPSVHDQVTSLLARKIAVPENGVTRMLSLQETMLLAVGQKAVRGDLKAVAFLLNLREATRDSTSTLIDPAELAGFDQATLKRYLQDVMAREEVVGDIDSQGGTTLKLGASAETTVLIGTTDDRGEA